MSVSATQCSTGTVVEGFAFWLDDFDTVLAASNSVQEIEVQLMSKLENPVRLLRWAIVKVEGTRFLCEGAALLEN